MKKILTNAIIKCGSAIAACAFVFVTAAANSACLGPFCEPQEPADLSRFKKHNK